MNKSFSISELPQIACEVINSTSNKIFLISGTMGVGKTTLIKEICNTLGTLDVVSSPSFSIVNQYLTCSDETIYHFDLYRIDDKEDMLHIGIEDYFDSDAWCLVEWPSLIENLVPSESNRIHLTELDNGQRRIQLTYIS